MGRMRIAELETLPNLQVIAVDNKTGHAIAIIRAECGGYRLYDGNSMTAHHSTEIEHPHGKPSFSIEEVREMFVSRRYSVLRGFIPD